MSQNYGELFVAFLDFYVQYEFFNLEIHPTRPFEAVLDCPIKQVSSVNELGVGGIRIIDPLDNSNNVAKSSFNI